MLTISPVNNIEYYSDLAAEDYYTGSGEPPGIWYGQGARQLGLCHQQVLDEDYKNLMNGYSPKGEALTQNAGDEKRRNAWDCTFSCPKSVSLLWAAADPDLQKKIKDAQQRAVQRAIDYIERNSAITRRGKSGENYEQTAGLIAATFHHCTNREQQPQLHTHTLILNVAPRQDSTWGSVDSRKLYLWQKASGAIFRVELAQQMRDLGFSVDRDGESFHISGISKNACQKYSKRAEDINKALTKSGINSSASKYGDRVKLETRKHKQPVDHQDLMTNWKNDLKDQGIEKELIDSIRSEGRQSSKRSIEPEQILDEITVKHATFSAQDVHYSTALQAVENGFDAREAEKIAKNIISNESIIEIQNSKEFSQKFTTEDVIATETLMTQTAKDLAIRSSKAVSINAIEVAIKAAEDTLGFRFDDEQLEAIHGALNSGNFSITQGSAGTGKTTLMLAAKHAYQKAGLHIEGACIAKKAADNLTEETGIRSQTVASIIRAIDDGKNPLTKIDVLVIDESGQLPSTDLQQLLHAANTADCKLILTGEDKQLDAINRGGALRYLSSPEIVGTQRLQNIRRQRQKWSRQVVADLRDGKASTALSSLKKHSCLHWGDNNDDAKSNLIKDWHSYQQNNPDKQSLVMAQKWTDVKELSNIIRSIYIEEGKVGTDNIPLLCSVAEKQFEYEFSVGDRIKFCRNEYKQLQVSNGTLGTIKHIEQLDSDVKLTVETDDKRQVDFLASDYSDERGTNICLAYALTVYSSQGTTIDGNTFTLYSGGMDRANSYVALSRHKDEAHLYINRSEINERAGGYDSGVVLTDTERLTTLSSLMRRNNYSSLAIEELAEQYSAEQAHQIPEMAL